MAWTKGEAEDVSKLLQKAIDKLHKINEKNEQTKHAMHGSDLSQHASAKSAEYALHSVKGTMDTIAFSKGRKKR